MGQNQIHKHNKFNSQYVEQSINQVHTNPHWKHSIGQALSPIPFRAKPLEIQIL